MSENVFLDIESTGLKAYNNQVAQLSYLITKGDEIVQAKNFFFTVNQVEPGAENVHGLSKEILEKLSEGKVFADYAEEILKDFEGKTVIGHNVSFDLDFLSEEFDRLGMDLNIKDSFCTMHHYTDICQIGYNSYFGTYKWPKLEEVIDYLGIDSKDIYKKSISLFGESKEFHDSRYDITGTYEIYKKINI